MTIMVRIHQHPKFQALPLMFFFFFRKCPETSPDRRMDNILVFNKPTTWCKCGWVSLVSSSCLYKTHPESVLAQLCHTRTDAWASCQIRKIAGAHAPGMPGTFSLSPQVSDPDMHHGTCVTHVPWCMPGSLTSGFLWNRRRGKTFPAFPAHAQPAILRIW